MQHRSEDPLLGTVVDNRYRVLERIADGGMSTVYKALHVTLERPVALKVLHPQLASDEVFVERFAREARASARLSHPHVVSVLDHGRHGRLTYLVMEYIEGRTLRDVIRTEGALTPRVAISYLAPALEGLAAAHEAGLIHRDVKPENVLISREGAVKIGDFGLARQATAQTSTGELLGTVAYLSPELFLRHDADARSDVYSCGIMLYELLTGGVPFTGDMPIQVAYQHVNDQVPAPSLKRPGLAQDFDELVLWATAKAPDERPVDARAFLGELRHVAATLPAADLDLPAPGAPASSPFEPRPAGPGGPSANPAYQSASQGGGATEVIGAQGLQTTVLPAGERHTTVLGSPDPLATSVIPQSGQSTTVLPHTPGAPPSKRQQRKDDKERARQEAKALATPTRQVRQGNPRRKGVIWVVVLVLLALLASGAGWFFGMGPGAQVTLPDLKSQPAEQAASILAGYGIKAEQQEVFDEKVGSGLVVATEPPAGTVIRKFEGVQLLVSKGPQLFPVPGLVKKTLDDARSALTTANLAAGTVTEKYSETVPTGQVIAQSPGGGAQVRRGTPVNLTVSKGPEPVPVPSVLGLSEDDATQKLTAAGFEVKAAQEQVFSKDVPAGRVAAQVPANGTLFKGDTVTLTLSKGPRPVEVPDFVGKQATVAKAELEKLGFTVVINEVLGGFFGTVRTQDPRGGTAPEGSTITLTVV
ncbi:PASTA domain-containing protein [Arthrobacter sp. Y-9]|uniref:Stk1 family PASTA domain-containing Ser/Thr kinase n=1 Tax=Arthrobacter sp. Y-9 TaxID=3039385 RepID=UPI00241D7C04|nr:PASTA domain-containing protein [Arthrobacter sp. Y-9]WFR85277.1 PASTA domain-containing protein [Arthrobacter sp. Y-9]